MQIDTWQASDNLAVSELEKTCFSDPWSYESVCQTAAMPNFVGVVARGENGVIGYAGAIYALDGADIALVAVDKAYRRAGYGFVLVSALIEKLSKLGVKRVFLEVRVSNVSARSLYEKVGFVPVGVRKRYYEDFEDALVMEIKIVD